MALSALKQLLKRRLLARSYATHFNVPVRFTRHGYQVNERILELPYVFAHLPSEPAGKRVLEFGCTGSTLALSLASLGFEVTGVDLRPCELEHPRFRFLQGNLLDLELPAFDVITAISVIEHVGLGFYRESRDERALLEVLRRLSGLLAPGGRAIFTVPCGQPRVDRFMRSFAPEEFPDVCRRGGFEPLAASFYRRAGLRDWSPCSPTEAAEISNDPAERGRTGVNGVGCFVFGRADG